MSVYTENQIKELGNLIKKQKIIILEPGDRIHLKSKRGIYTVLLTQEDGLHISSKVQIARAGNPEIIPTEFIKYDEVKCFAGNQILRRNSFAKLRG